MNSSRGAYTAPAQQPRVIAKTLRYKPDQERLLRRLTSSSTSTPSALAIRARTRIDALRTPRSTPLKYVWCISARDANSS